ncbi:hypothetical protein N9A04_00970 [Rickettsiales bacterium]|nr:hypothetical protein [Rickettsiales bacterium]
MFAGYMFNLDKNFSISVGYRFTFIIPTKYPSPGAPIQGYPPTQDMSLYTEFDLQMIHKIEVAFWIF